MLFYILSQTKEEDKENIAWLYCEHIDCMIAFAKARLNEANDQNAEHDCFDVVQNAFMKIIKYKKIDFSKNPEELKSYLRAVVMNEVSNLLNDIRYVKTFDEERGTAAMSEEEFLDKLCIEERYVLVMKAIDFLDDRYASIMTLSTKHTPNEISEIMGMPVKTVYTRLERARRFLLQRIEIMEKEGVNNG